MNQPVTEFKKQVVVFMLGVPGAGKSYFARQLADRLNWQRLNRVALRKELFGSQASLHLPANEALLKEKLDKQLKRIIKLNQSIICDYKHNLRHERDYVNRLAEKVAALPISIWIQTPVKLAIKRGMNREDSADSIRGSYSHMCRITDNNLKNFEPPHEGEVVLKLDGLLSFEDQLEAFLKFCQEEFDCF